MKIRRHRHSMPELNTASLPDLIFTVLFFFMIITHMRENTVRVRYDQPAGTEVKKVERKSSVIRLYIGRPIDNPSADYCIQVDDRIMPVADIAQYINKERARMSADRAQHLTISFKADRQAPMWLVTQAKQALRQAGALRVSYSAYDHPLTSPPTP